MSQSNVPEYEINLLYLHPIKIIYRQQNNNLFKCYRDRRDRTLNSIVVEILDPNTGNVKDTYNLNSLIDQITNTNINKNNSDLIYKYKQLNYARKSQSKTFEKSTKAFFKTHADIIIYGIIQSLRKYYDGRATKIDLPKEIEDELKHIMTIKGPLDVLETRRFSGDVSGLLGELIFPYIMKTVFEIEDKYIVHLRPGKSTEQSGKKRSLLPTPDFLVLNTFDKCNSCVQCTSNVCKLINEMELEFMRTSYANVSHFFVEVKASFTRNISSERVCSAIRQLLRLLTSNGTFGLFFIVDRPSETKNNIRKDPLPLQVKLMVVLNGV